MDARMREAEQLPLFEGVDPAVVQQLSPLFSVQQHSSGAIILEQGKPVTRYRMITRGIVELTRVSDRDQIGVLLLSSKDMIMPSAVTFGEPALVTARALTTTRTLEIDAQSLGAALDLCPRLSRNLLRVVAGQWRMAVRNILELNARTAAQRLGAFLLRLADLQQDQGWPVLPISKRHLASRLGITPETLSRTLQTIAENGLHLRGRMIIVNDRGRIREFCGPDPYDEPDERPLNVFAF